MEIQDIEIGQWYNIQGNIENGYKDGKPYIGYDTVARVITRVTDTHVICECGRKFLINENLKIEK